MKKFFKKTEPYLIWLIPVIILLSILMFFFDKIANLFSDYSNVRFRRITIGSTLTSNEAKSIADSFYISMSGPGTNEALINELFKRMLKQSNFNKVYNNFGRRQYSVTWGNGGDPVTSSNRDLIFWLNSELTQEEKKYLKDTYPKIKIF